MKIVLTQGQYVEVDADDFDYLNQWTWHAAKRHIRKDGTSSYDAKRSWCGCSISMTHVLMLPKPYYCVHHKNGDTLDNRRTNLESLPYEEHLQLHNQKNL